MLVKAAVLSGLLVGAALTVPSNPVLAAWNGASVQVPGIPAGATASPGLEGGAPVGGGLDSIACTSSSECVALGNDEIAGGVSSMFVDTLTSGTWTSNSIPGTLDKQRVTSVGCTSTGNCLAVGTRDVGNICPIGSTGFTIEELGGVWQSPSLLPAPGGVGSYVMSLSVSCVVGAACTILGWQETEPGKGDSFWQTWTSGSGLGAATTIPNPSGSNEMALRAVSCVSASWCAAVGESQGDAVAVQESSGSWGAPTSIPGGLPVFYNPGGQLLSVSCASVGNCAAVGYFYFSAQLTSPMYAVDMKNGTWGTPQALLSTVPVPSDRLGYQEWNGPTSVACDGAPMTCSLATLIGDSVRGSVGAIGQSRNSEWGQLTRVPAPAPVGHQYAITAVACPTSSSCVGVGDETSGIYNKSESFVPRAFAWQPSGIAPRPIAPQHVRVNGGVNVLVTWNAPVGVTPATRYKLWAVRGAVLMSAPVVTTATQFTFARLTPHTTYEFVVQSIGSDGQGSTPVTSGSIHTTVGVPGAVVLSSVTSGRGLLTASWQEPFYSGGAPVSSYALRVVGGGKQELLKVAASTRTRVVRGLTRGDTYAVSVAAVNRAGSGPFSRTLDARVT